MESQAKCCFFPKTKLSGVEMPQLTERVLSVQGCEFIKIYMESQGRPGGLALIWLKEV